MVNEGNIEATSSILLYNVCCVFTQLSKFLGGYSHNIRYNVFPTLTTLKLVTKFLDHSFGNVYTVIITILSVIHKHICNLLYPLLIQLVIIWFWPSTCKTRAICKHCAVQFRNSNNVYLLEHNLLEGVDSINLSILLVSSVTNDRNHGTNIHLWYQKAVKSFSCLGPKIWCR